MVVTRLMMAFRLRLEFDFFKFACTVQDPHDFDAFLPQYKRLHSCRLAAIVCRAGWPASRAPFWDGQLTNGMFDRIRRSAYRLLPGYPQQSRPGFHAGPLQPGKF